MLAGVGQNDISQTWPASRPLMRCTTSPHNILAESPSDLLDTIPLPDAPVHAEPLFGIGAAFFDEHGHD